ncbi:MAG TPA: DUF2238 domain-containing protein [Candidatus Binatia bacterium]|nr:DUF2238 domain-containing protein [Candidatus Binatia bacterium]
MHQRGFRLIASLFILSIVLFGFTFIKQGNDEFLAYQVTIVGYAFALYFLHRQFRFSNLTLGGMTLLAIMHMLGGVDFGYGLIYGKMLFPIGNLPIFRYDNLVHFYGTFMVAWVLHQMIQPSLKRDGILPHLIIALGALGIGAVVEITEFFVALSTPHNFVGDVTNTSLDLVFNSLGAITAMLVSSYREWRK